MGVLCIGINHESAPVEIRERFAIAPGHLGETNRNVRGLAGVAEAVVVSTCNRMEIYAGYEEPVRAGESLREFLKNAFNIDDGMEVSFYRHQDQEAIRHLFAVASGMNSMVLGETEIFGQVKKAYAAAQEEGATARRLNKLFQHAFRAGKIVRTTTNLQRGATSVGSVAVDLAERIFGNLAQCEVMILGAGEMSRITAQSLLSRGAKSIFVSNRSYDNAVELAREMAGQAIRFDDWTNKAAGIDIVISSTAAPHTFVDREMVANLMSKRRGSPLFLIDIAVPRDIDADVNEVDGVYLYDMDALQQIAEQTKSRRTRELDKCWKIIDEQVGEAAPAVLGDARKPGVDLSDNPSPASNA